MVISVSEDGGRLRKRKTEDCAGGVVRRREETGFLLEPCRSTVPESPNATDAYQCTVMLPSLYQPSASMPAIASFRLGLPVSGSSIPICTSYSPGVKSAGMSIELL